MTIGGDCAPTWRNGSIITVCKCYARYGNIDCSYHRKSMALAGGLQIGFAFICLNGVGNFYLGRTSEAGGQLAMGLLSGCLIISTICIACCGYMTKIVGPSIGCGIFLGIMACMIITSGFIWTEPLK